MCFFNGTMLTLSRSNSYLKNSGGQVPAAKEVANNSFFFKTMQIISIESQVSHNGVNVQKVI